MAKIKELSQEEASKISDELDERGKKLGEYNQGKSISLKYEMDNKFYEIWITNDSSCWVVGGVLYDSIDDLNI